MNPEELPELQQAPMTGNGVSIDASDSSASTNASSYINTASLPQTESKLKRRVVMTVLIPVAIILLILFILLLFSSSRSDNDSQSSVVLQPVNEVDVSKLPSIALDVSQVKSAEVVFNNKLVANGALVLSPNLQPTESVSGQIYYDQLTDEVRIYDGTTYTSLVSKEAGQQICYIGADCGFASPGDIPQTQQIPDFPDTSNFITAADIPAFPQQITLPQNLSVTSSPTFQNINLAGNLAVSDGGTGASSFANNSLLIGNGTGAIGATNSAVSGQLVVANSTGSPQFVSLSGDATITPTGVIQVANNAIGANELENTGVTAGTFGDANNYPVFTVDADGRITAIANQLAPGSSGGVASLNSLTGALTIQGTPNQINVVSAGSTITLSTPQDLAATSSPTFSGLTVNSLTRGTDTITDFTGTGLQVTAGVLETTLGDSIQDAEVDDNITISAGGSVADGALSSNVALLDAAQTFTGLNTFGALITANGGLTVETGDTFTFNGDAFTDLSGTGLQVTAGVLETTLGTSIESAEITDGTIVNADLANSQLAVNTGSGLQGGGNISLGGSRDISLGSLSADWVQAGAYDIVLDNAGAQLRILEASGGLYYGEFDVADLNASRLYTFPDASGEVSVLGQTIDNGELANSSVTITSGAGLSGGGLVALGGSLALSSNLGDEITEDEVQDGTLLARDLNTTNTLGAGVNGYIYTYNNATGNFTLVDAASVGTAGVTTLNTLNGAVNIVGSTQLAVTPSGSNINLSIASDSITNAEIGAGAVGSSELASTTVTAGNYGSASSTGSFTVDADGRLTAASNSAIAIDGNQVTTGTVADARLSSNVALLDANNTFSAAGTALTVTNDATVSGTLTVGDLDCTDCLEAGNIATGAVATTEILNNTILAADLNYTNGTFGAGQNGYILTYDNASGGFTWVDQGTVGSTLSEAQVEDFIFDGDNGTKTLSSGRLALNSLTYTGNLDVAEGGTGLTSAGAAGGIYYSTGSAFANNGAGTAGQCLLSNGAGIPTWGSCGGSGAGAVTMQVTYDQGNTITTTTGRNITYTLANTATDADFLVNLATGSTGKSAFQINGTDLLRVDSNGVDLLDVDIADFTGAAVTFDAGEILETEIAQNTLDDSEIQDNSLTASSLADGSVLSAEIADGTIQELDLESTNAAVNDYVLTYDSTSGGFTWVSQASVAAAGGVSSLNSLTGALDIVGNSQLTVTPLGSNINLSVTADSIGNTQLEFDTGQNLTTASNVTFADVTSNGQIAANRTNNQFALIDADTAATEWTISTVADEDFGLYENGSVQRLLLTAAGDLTISGDATFTGGNITIGSTNISEADIDALDDGSIDLTAEINNTLGILNGGTGATTFSNGVIFGNGTSALTSTGVLGNGQLIIGDGAGNPTIGTLTGGAGITVVNGAGSITINNDLGTDIESTEILDNTIQEEDLEVTNAGVNNYILSYNSATGGFTWVDPTGVGVNEATVEDYIFDGDNGGKTLSSGTLALNSLSYTGSLGVSNGGTGLTAAGAAGGVFYSDGSAFVNTGAGSSGNCLLSNGAGAPSWGLCGGAGSGTTLQTAYDGGGTINTADNKNIAFNLTDTTTDSNFVVNLLGGNSQFDIQDGGVSKLTLEGGNGYLGVNDNTPSYQLDVSGTGRFTNDLLVDGNTTLGNTTSDTTKINGGLTVDVGRGDVYFENNANDNVDGAGITLRTSSNPTTGSIFAVRSSGEAPRLWVGQSVTSTGNNDLYVGTSGNDGVATPQIQLLASGNATFNGNVGIGIASSTSRLTVAGDIDYQNNAIIASTASASNIDHIWHDDGTNSWNFNSDITYKAAGNSTLIAGGANFSSTVSAGGASGDAYLIGNDSKLVDINVANTAGLYGIQNSTVGSLRLGSSGPTLSGLSGQLNLNTDLVVSGEITSNSNNIGFANGGRLIGSNSTLDVRPASGSNYGLIIRDPTVSAFANLEVIENGTNDYLQIGTNTSAGTLRVFESGTTYATGNIRGESFRVANGTFAAGGSNGNVPTIYAEDDTNTGFLFSTSDVNAFRFVGGGHDLFSCNLSGSCNVGGASSNGSGSSLNLFVNGRVSDCTIGNGTGNTACTSDSRKKNTITAAGGNLAKITQLNPVTFKWNSQGTTGPTRLGLIAQEVLPYFPEAVVTDADGFYSLDYGVLTSPLIGAVKELKVIDDAQTARLNAVESLLAVLESTTNNLTKNNLTVTNTTNTLNLTVTGTATIANLKVTGTTEVANLKVAGKIITAGNAPTAVLGASAGTGSAHTLSGNDTAGTVEITTGSSAVSGSQITVRFDQSFIQSPRIALTAKNNNAAAVDYYVDTFSTGFKVYFIDTPTANTQYEFDYIVIQ